MQMLPSLTTEPSPVHQLLTGREETLNELARAGDHQALLDLYAMLQPGMAHYASRLIGVYRHALPASLEASDLAQEASLAMYRHLEEASSKDSPIAYLIATGRSTIRSTCLAALQEPRQRSLDAPCSQQNETPLHDYLPSPDLLAADKPAETEYQPLYEAISRLPQAQQTLMMQRFGLGNQPAVSQRDLAQQTGKSGGTISHAEHRVYTALYFHLKAAYPHYAENALAHKPNGRDLWQRLEQAYTELSHQGQHITLHRLAQAAKTRPEDARAFLWEREGTERVQKHPWQRQAAWQRLEQAYTELSHQGQHITIRALARQARSDTRTVSQYLKERFHG